MLEGCKVLGWRILNDNPTMSLLLAQKPSLSMLRNPFQEPSSLFLIF